MFEKWSKEGFEKADDDAKIAEKMYSKVGSLDHMESYHEKQNTYDYLSDKAKEKKAKADKILGAGMKEAGKINEQYDEKLLNVNKSIDDLYAFRQAELDMTGRQAAEAEIKDLENILNERKKLFEAEYEQKEN
jgi:hypothetical protein